MSNQFKHTRAFFLVITLFIAHDLVGAISQYSKSDPYPVYTTLDPHLFLYTYRRQLMKDLPTDRTKQEWFSVSLSPFGQNAVCARDGFRTCCGALQVSSTPCDDIPLIPIADLGGRWGMIALLYGPLPAGRTLPPTLVEARNILFPMVPPGTVLDDPLFIDPNQQWGFFTIPSEFRKRGVRAEFNFLVLCDWGLSLKIGYADICEQGRFENITNLSTVNIPAEVTAANPAITKENINTALMLELTNIAPEIGLDIGRFHDSSIEDIKPGIWWRHAYLINKNKRTFPEFLLIPWFLLEASAAVSKERPRCKFFAVPFGNDGHNAISLSGGLNIDFTQTIEIGGEGGFTHFFSNCFSGVRIPNSDEQSGVYPFFTDACIQPGTNFYCGAKMSAYHFLDRLSFFFQWIMVSHLDDCICVKPSDPGFLPHELEKKSSFKVHLANIGFNYDISPNISLGFLWQAPLAQYNTYRSTTIMFGFNATY